MNGNINKENHGRATCQVVRTYFFNNAFGKKNYFTFSNMKNYNMQMTAAGLVDLIFFRTLSTSLIIQIEFNRKGQLTVVHICKIFIYDIFFSLLKHIYLDSQSKYKTKLGIQKLILYNIFFQIQDIQWLPICIMSRCRQVGSGFWNHKS